MSDEEEEIKAVQRVADKIGSLAAIRYTSLDELQEKYRISRKEARELIRLAHKENEEDNLAYAPSSTDYLEERLNTGINRELDRLLMEQAELEGVIRSALINKDPGGKYEGPGGIPLNKQEAEQRLEIVFTKLMEIRKGLSVRKEGAGGGVNLEFNLGDIVSGAVDKIKSADYEQID